MPGFLEKTLGSLEKTVLTLEKTVLTLGKTVSTFVFSKVRTVFPKVLTVFIHTTMAICLCVSYTELTYLLQKTVRSDWPENKFYNMSL